MNNATSHSSRSTTEFLRKNGINHFKTPAQSPDFNPIELVWNDRSDYINNHVKPNNAEELRLGILEFWILESDSNSQLLQLKNKSSRKSIQNVFTFSRKRNWTLILRL